MSLILSLLSLFTFSTTDTGIIEKGSRLDSLVEYSIENNLSIRDTTFYVYYFSNKEEK